MQHLNLDNEINKAFYGYILHNMEMKKMELLTQSESHFKELPLLALISSEVDQAH